MTRYIIRRVLLLVPVLLGISIVTFAMLRLIPGDPAQIMLGEHATPDAIARIRARMGLDQPLPVQYVRYLGDVLRLDLGRSIKTNRPVTQEIAQRFPATVELTLGAMLVACLIGIPAGILAAYKHNSGFDLATMVGALIGVFSVGFHGFVDFNLSIPANLTTFFALLAVGFVVSNRHLLR